MERNGPIDIDARGRAYRASGWRAFDETADPYSPSDMCARAQPLSPQHAGLIRPASGQGAPR